MTKLDKTLTGISAEMFAAGELARRGFNVTITFGNTKAIDLLTEVDGRLLKFQVKGMQSKKSICWNVTSLTPSKDLYFIFINLNADKLDIAPDFFVLSSEEVDQHLKRVASGRHYIDYNYLVKNGFSGGWEKLGGKVNCS
jgi:hypothetical protein